MQGLSETEAGLIVLPMTLISGLVIAAAICCLIGSAGVLILSRSGWIGWVVLVTLVFDHDRRQRRPGGVRYGWTGPLGPLSRRSDCMMANVVV